MNIYELLSTSPSIKGCLSKNRVLIGNTCDDFNMMLVACDFYL